MGNNVGIYGRPQYQHPIKHTLRFGDNPDSEELPRYDLVASFEWKSGWNPSYLSQVFTYTRKGPSAPIRTRADPFNGISPEAMYFQYLLSYTPY